MENIIPAITGELIRPLLETSNWEPLKDVEIILYKGIIEPELDEGEGEPNEGEGEPEPDGGTEDSGESTIPGDGETGDTPSEGEGTEDTPSEGEGTEDTPEPEEEINGWIHNTDETKLYVYSQTVECKGIKESSKFFVDLAIDKYNDIEDIFTVQDEWALISRVISNGTKETDGTLTFYIYEDSVPTLDLHVRVRFANT